MSKMDGRTKEMIAAGVAGFALSMELLTTLNKLGVISDDGLLEVADGALTGVEVVDSAHRHEIFRRARDLLGWHLASFRKQIEQKPAPDPSTTPPPS
jgi:hypothetical protein